MMVLVHGNGFGLERDLRESVLKKVEYSLARFSRRVAKVDVYLVDVNGPKKGIDKLIRLILNIDRQPKIVIEEKGEDWGPVLDCVTDRAVHSMSRQIEKSRSRIDRTKMSGNGRTSMFEQSVARNPAGA